MDLIIIIIIIITITIQNVTLTPVSDDSKLKNFPLLRYHQPGKR